MLLILNIIFVNFFFRSGDSSRANSPTPVSVQAPKHPSPPPQPMEEQTSPETSHEKPNIVQPSLPTSSSADSISTALVTSATSSTTKIARSTTSPSSIEQQKQPKVADSRIAFEHSYSRVREIANDSENKNENRYEIQQTKKQQKRLILLFIFITIFKV